MNVEVPNRQAATGLLTRALIADADIHHSPRDFKMLYRYLPQRWKAMLDEYGQRARQGNASGPQYPKGQPDASRRDAWPPGGGRPGSDLGFMRTHHLDANGIDLGVLNMIRPHPGGFSNLDLSVAVARAINDWQVAEWTQPEPRLKASLVVPYEDTAASVAEIERWAGHPDIVQVLLLSRTRAPLGNPRYRPIFQAATDAGWPVGIHAFGNGGHPVTSHGWPSHYIEDMLGHAQSCQAMLTSMVVEGLFEAVDRASVPALADLSPRAFTPGVTAPAVTFDNLVLLYSPERVKPAPTSWKVFWDPKYKDQIAINGVPDIVGLGFLMMANKTFGGEDYRQLEKGFAAVADMAPNVLSWDPKPDAYSFITNGTASLGVGWNARGQIYSDQSGGKLAAVLPQEGALFQINVLGLVKGAKQPDAARAFMNHALGAQAQAAFTERMFYAPVNLKAQVSAAALAKTAASPERMAKMLDVDWLEVAKFRESVTEQWRRRVLTRR